MADSNDIIARLSDRLSLAMNNDRQTPDMGTRHIGGSFRHNHPYISGYFHAMWNLPAKIFNTETKARSEQWLASTCESFTPPKYSEGGKNYIY